MARFMCRVGSGPVTGAPCLQMMMALHQAISVILHPSALFLSHQTQPTIDQYCSLCSYRHGDRNVKFSGQFTCDNGLRSMVFDGEGNLYIGYRGYAGSSHGPGYQDGVMPSYIVWKSKADGSVYSFEITKAPLRHFNLDTARQDE